MRLSEAIRLGSTLGPQLRDGRLVGPRDSSCALGAALLALGADCEEARTSDPLTCPWYFVYKLTQEQIRLNGLLPLYFPALTVQLQLHIGALNDTIKMSRQEIADWLVRNNLDFESVETPQQEQHECQVNLVTA